MNSFKSPSVGNYHACSGSPHSSALHSSSIAFRRASGHDLPERQVLFEACELHTETKHLTPGSVLRSRLTLESTILGTKMPQTSRHLDFTVSEDFRAWVRTRCMQKQFLKCPRFLQHDLHGPGRPEVKLSRAIKGLVAAQAEACTAKSVSKQGIDPHHTARCHAQIRGQRRQVIAAAAPQSTHGGEPPLATRHE